MDRTLSHLLWFLSPELFYLHLSPPFQVKVTVMNLSCLSRFLGSMAKWIHGSHHQNCRWSWLGLDSNAGNFYKHPGCSSVHSELRATPWRLSSFSSQCAFFFFITYVWFEWLSHLHNFGCWMTMMVMVLSPSSPSIPFSLLPLSDNSSSTTLCLFLLYLPLMEKIIQNLPCGRHSLRYWAWDCE